MARANTKDTVWVSDFGARANSFENSVTAIQQAIAHCKTTGAKVLAFPKGRYDIWSDGAIRREYFISNTANEQDCPSKIKTVGILLDGMKDLTVEGNGSTIMCHNKMITVAIDRSQNVTIDFERPSMSEMTITAVGDGFVDVVFHRDSRYSIIDGKIALHGEGWKSNDNHCIEYDPNMQTMRYSKMWHKLSACPAQELAFLKVRFTTPAGVAPRIGNILTVRDIIRDQVGVFNFESRDVTYRNVNMRYMHGLGMVSQFTENVTMDGVNCEPDPKSGRVTASSADFMHFSGCRGLVQVVNCRFAGAHDDPVNIHGTNLKIVENMGKNRLKLRFSHHQSYGFNAFSVGDQVAFVRANEMIRYAEAKVKKIERISERELILTLDGSLPTDIGSADCLENLTWTPEVLIKNNYFSRVVSRGVLITTPRKAVIEDNTFFRCGMSAVLIASDTRDWFESGPVGDVTIRNNTFIDCGYEGGVGGYIIALDPSNNILNAEKPVHRNITIENNTFVTYDMQILYAKSTQGIRFNGNTIKRSYTMPSVSTRNSSFKFEACKDVEIGPIQLEGDVLGQDIVLTHMPKEYLKNGSDFSIRK